MVSSMRIAHVSLPNQRFDLEMLGSNHRSMRIARHRELHANSLRNSFRFCFQALGVRAAKFVRRACSVGTALAISTFEHQLILVTNLSPLYGETT
jgi:hypothetical protein